MTKLVKEINEEMVVNGKNVALRYKVTQCPSYKFFAGSFHYLDEENKYISFAWRKPFPLPTVVYKNTRFEFESKSHKEKVLEGIAKLIVMTWNEWKEKKKKETVEASLPTHSFKIMVDRVELTLEAEAASRKEAWALVKKDAEETFGVEGVDWHPLRSYKIQIEGKETPTEVRAFGFEDLENKYGKYGVGWQGAPDRRFRMSTTLDSQPYDLWLPFKETAKYSLAFDYEVSLKEAAASITSIQRVFAFNVLEHGDIEDFRIEIAADSEEEALSSLREFMGCDNYSIVDGEEEEV